MIDQTLLKTPTARLRYPVSCLGVPTRRLQALRRDVLTGVGGPRTSRLLRKRPSFYRSVARILGH